MDLLDHTNKLIKIRIEELENKIKSKSDLYYVLCQWCMYFIYIIRPILNTIQKLNINQIYQRCILWEEKSNLSLAIIGI